jgi:hypothetical protein
LGNFDIYMQSRHCSDKEFVYDNNNGSGYSRDEARKRVHELQEFDVKELRFVMKRRNFKPIEILSPEDI